MNTENDWKNIVEYARKEGERRGVEQTARRLRRMGMPPADIAAATGLDVGEIEKL